MTTRQPPDEPPPLPTPGRPDARGDGASASASEDPAHALAAELAAYYGTDTIDFGGRRPKALSDREFIDADAPSAPLTVPSRPAPSAAPRPSPRQTALYRSLRRMTRKRKRLRRVLWATYRRLRNRRVHLAFMACVIGACAGATALFLRFVAHHTIHGIHILDRKVGEHFTVAEVPAAPGAAMEWPAWMAKIAASFGVALTNPAPTMEPPGWLLKIAPGFGLVLTVVLVRYVLRDPAPASVFSVLKAIRTHGYLRFRHILSSIGGCALTLGFGGSVGMEAPAIATGSTVGSNLAEQFRMSRARRSLLIACGAAGGIAAIFNAPLAGFLFAAEVLLVGGAVEWFVPLLLASVSGNVVGRVMFTADTAIFAPRANAPYLMRDLLASAVLGVLCGLMSTYFLWAFGRVRRWLTVATRFGVGQLSMFRGWRAEAIDASKTAVFAKALFAGALLTAMIHFAPSLYGDGMGAMRLIERGETEALMKQSVLSPWAHWPWMVVVYALAVPMLKALATAVTLSGGGVGGIFIPCLFMGCFTGWGFARAANLLFGGGVIADEARYIMAGMAGMVAGVVHAPLTGIFLCVENSGWDAWFVPYIVTAAFAYLTHIHFQPYSVYSGGPEAAESPVAAVERPSMRF